MSNQTPNTLDDLDAVKKIVEALTPFVRGDQERILRWSVEKLGVSLADLPPVRRVDGDQKQINVPADVSTAGRPVGANIRDFVAAKSPRSDNQFAAVVAYYYRFEAPVGQRKEFITSEDLQEACRQAGRERLKSPNATLNNAHSTGLLDRGKTGEFAVNAVGENLVAMTLPATSGVERSKSKKAKPSKISRKSKKVA
ncbi:MAG: hypothetical protein WDM80_13870 [Limisphaerales bacterium]